MLASYGFVTNLSYFLSSNVFSGPFRRVRLRPPWLQLVAQKDSWRSRWGLLLLRCVRILIWDWRFFCTNFFHVENLVFICVCILGSSSDLRTSGMHFLVVLVLRLLEAAQNCRDGRDWRHNRHRHEIGKFRMWPLWLLLHRSHYKVSQMVKSHSSQLITASIVEFNCAMKWRLCLTLHLQNKLERVVEAFRYIR